MPAFTYTGTDERYYPGIGREVRPGDSVQWDADPEDGRWSAVAESAPAAPAPVTAPPAAPAVIDASEAAPTSIGGAA
jgi:hypothetical protein